MIMHQQVTNRQQLRMPCVSVPSLMIQTRGNLGYYRYTRNHWTYNYHESLTDSFQIVRSDENTILAEPIFEEQVGTVSETHHHLGALLGGQYRLSHRWLSNTLGAELQAHYQQGNPSWYAYASYVAERRITEQWSVAGGMSFLWNFGGSGIKSNYMVLNPYGFGVQVGVNYRLRLPRR